MNPVNRRELCIALSSLAALVATPAVAQTNEPGQKPEIVPPLPPDSNASTASSKPQQGAVLDTPHAYRFEDLAVKKNANGESRPVVSGTLPTGEAVELHETSLLPGHMPHPAHKHRHSEFMFIREGTLEFDNNGKPERVGPGGVVFAASNIMHGLKNVGDTTAQYFVIAIGRES
jgi:quercetin dioxygenase-like cupin family protein